MSRSLCRIDAFEYPSLFFFSGSRCPEPAGYITSSLAGNFETAFCWEFQSNTASNVKSFDESLDLKLAAVPAC